MTPQDKLGDLRAMDVTPLTLLLIQHTWAGTVASRCTLVGETRTRLRVVFDRDTRLPGGRIAEAGKPVLVPRSAVRVPGLHAGV